MGIFTIFPFMCSITTCQYWKVAAHTHVGVFFYSLRVFIHTYGYKRFSVILNLLPSSLMIIAFYYWHYSSRLKPTQAHRHIYLSVWEPLCVSLGEEEKEEQKPRTTTMTENPPNYMGVSFMLFSAPLFLITMHYCIIFLTAETTEDISPGNSFNVFTTHLHFHISSASLLHFCVYIIDL